MQRQTFDSGYLQRLAQADPATERDFTSYFGELLAIKLRSRLRSADLIADVTQETFVRVFTALREGAIETPAALGAFVNTVCNNILFEIYRLQSRLTPELEDRASSDLPAELEMVSDEERRRVHQILAELPDKDRAILCGLFIEEREKGDLCRSLGIDRDYLRVLLHRAKKRFRTDWIKRGETKAARATPMS